MNKKKLIGKKTLIFSILLILEVTLYCVIIHAINEYREKRVYTSGNEYVQTIDCAPIFDKYPNAQFKITFDIRTSIPGNILVYQQNHDSSKYMFSEVINVTQEFQTFELIVRPKLYDKRENMSYLSFYGEYGSGVIPEVKNINIEIYNNQEITYDE